MTRHAWQAAAAVLALLALGAVLGIAVDRFHVRGRDHATALLAEIERDPMGVIEREITLRPEQRGPIRAILERYQATMDSVWRESNLRLRATVQGVVSDIAAQLDSAQAARFRALIEEIHGSPQSMFHGRSH
jgi:hypothetical protein